MDNPSLIELLLSIINNTLKRIKLAAAIVIIPTVVVFVLVMWVIKPNYASNAIVTPPTSQTSIGSISSLLGPGVSSMGSLLGLNSGDGDVDAVWTILNSWEIHNQVIEKFNLAEHYEFDGNFHADLLKLFRKNFSLELNNEKMFVITVKDKDYKMATRMVEFILAKSDSAFNHFKSTQARLSREYFDSRIALSLHELDSLKDKFIKFQTENNFYAPLSQLEGTLKYLGEIQSLKEKVGIERSYEKLKQGSDESKKYDELNKRYQTIDASLNKTLAGKQEDVGLISLKKTPELAAEYLRIEEEIKVQVALYKILRQQSEELRIEEAKMLKNLHILEPPWENNKKISPLRGVSLVFTFAVSSMFAMLLCTILAFLDVEIEKNSTVAKEWNRFLGFFKKNKKQV